MNRHDDEVAGPSAVGRGSVSGRRASGAAFALALACLVWAWASGMDPAVRAAAGDDPVPGTLRAKEIEVRIPVKMRYWLYLPSDYESKSEWPLLLFLHGAGERGDDLEKVKVHGPPKLLASGEDSPVRQFIVVAPQCSMQDGWWRAEALAKLVEELAGELKVDRSRIYATGLSMGGYGTWALLGQRPDLFAAVAPVCGGGQPVQLRFAPGVKDVPVWAFHGAKDNVVPLRASEEMVAAVKGLGGEAKLTVYPDAGHDSWTETYANPELYAWLLSHRKIPAGEDAKK